jgi:hypothetical protein
MTRTQRTCQTLTPWVIVAGLYLTAFLCGAR